MQIKNTKIKRMFTVLSVPLLMSATLPSLYDAGQKEFYLGNYLAPIVALEPHQTAYLKDETQQHSYVQHMATHLSYVGRYQESLEMMDALNTPGPERQTSLPRLTFVPARQALLELAKDTQVLMINEAHHVPRHRALTLSLLADLYAQGYRYLAMEALNAFDKTIQLRGFPVVGMTGPYTSEPVMGELVRQAVKLGYTLVAYEEQSECIPPEGAGWQYCANQRDAKQAKNLYEHTLKKDPRARVLVHAGYSHINERPQIYSKGEKWQFMAQTFHQLSGVNPLTVNQTDWSPASRLTFNAEIYQSLLQQHHPKTAGVFYTQDQRVWVAPRVKNSNDVQVFHPPAQYKQGRPTWMTQLLDRTLIKVSAAWCQGQYPCLVQAFYKGEKPTLAVPVDQIMLRQSQEKQSLALPKGPFLVQVKNAKGVVLKQFEQRI